MLRPLPRGPGVPPRHRPGQIPQIPIDKGPSDDAPAPESSTPSFQPCGQGQTPSDASGVWVWPPRPPYGPGDRPSQPPGAGPWPNPPSGPGSGPYYNMPPLAPGGCPPPVSQLELAAAYVPFQAFTTIFGPGESPAPGTIFPELLRTPPLYRWPPCTDGRV